MSDSLIVFAVQKNQLGERVSVLLGPEQYLLVGCAFEIANLAYWVTGTEGSNPSLSANQSQVRGSLRTGLQTAGVCGGLKRLTCAPQNCSCGE